MAYNLSLENEVSLHHSSPFEVKKLVQSSIGKQTAMKLFILGWKPSGQRVLYVFFQDQIIEVLSIRSFQYLQNVFSKITLISVIFKGISSRKSLHFRKPLPFHYGRIKMKSGGYIKRTLAKKLDKVIYLSIHLKQKLEVINSICFNFLGGSPLGFSCE